MAFDLIRGQTVKIFRIAFIAFFGLERFIYGFLKFILPVTASWMPTVVTLAWIPLLLVGLAMLIFRRWKGVTAIALAFGLQAIWSAPVIGSRPLYWAMTQGFRFHAWPSDRYLQRCDLKNFLKDDVTYRVGDCHDCYQFLDEPFYECVFYDASGEISLPASERNREWWNLMPNSRDRTLNPMGRTVHLFGNFYFADVISMNVWVDLKRAQMSEICEAAGGKIEAAGGKIEDWVCVKGSG